MRRAIGLFAIAIAAACAPPKRFTAPPAAVPHGVPPAIGELLPRAQAFVDGHDVVYVSDYFSFAGRDANGRVLFAIDDNRGKAGASFQADQRPVMWDEASGAFPDVGSEHLVYPNRNGALWTIPDSPEWRFTGDAAHGWKLESTKGMLTLTIDPLAVRTFDEGAIAMEAMSSAAATLTWNGRTIPGRVICEWLVLRDRNLLAVKPKLSDAAKWHFEGLYLTDGTGDLYAHANVGSGLAGLAPVLGFDGASRLDDLALVFETTKKDFAGLHRWPSRWRVRWKAAPGLATIEVHTLARKKMSGWVIGGYAMSAVEGERVVGAERVPVFGFAEIID